jgi:hypothetical protein
MGIKLSEKCHPPAELTTKECLYIVGWDGIVLKYYSDGLEKFLLLLLWQFYYKISDYVLYIPFLHYHPRAELGLASFSLCDMT